MDLVKFVGHLTNEDDRYHSVGRKPHPAYSSAEALDTIVPTAEEGEKKEGRSAHMRIRLIPSTYQLTRSPKICGSWVETYGPYPREYTRKIH
jgi:hypothetical protein